jgi:hypothetical protein
MFCNLCNKLFFEKGPLFELDVEIVAGKEIYGKKIPKYTDDYKNSHSSILLLELSFI